jgi:transglutaminase-like putative cysteine protease
MQVRVGCEFVQNAEFPTHTVLQVEPRPDGEFDLARAEWDLHTAEASRRYLDGFGNVCRRLTIPAGTSTIRYDAIVNTPGDPDTADPSAEEIAPEHLPDEALVYTLPSRYCPSAELSPVAWDLFSGVPLGWSRVTAICDWVHDSVTFGYGTSNPSTTAADVLEARIGVCRDFVHLALTFCRALGIPARYAFGYLPTIDVPPLTDPMDFAAWMEVYLGDRWWTFDPRNNERRRGRVLIGRGRDALDVAMLSSFGTVDLTSMDVWSDKLSD